MRQINPQDQKKKDRKVFSFLILLLILIVIASVFFSPGLLIPDNQVSILQFSLLSQRIADYSADPLLLSFQPISLNVIDDILRDKQPDDPGLDKRIAVSYTHLTLPTTPYV